MKKVLVLLITHTIFAIVGFSAGIYLLPVLTATPGPSESVVASAKAQSRYEGYFVKELEGSDFLHWGEGKVLVGAKQIAFEGKLAPGPDYKLYLSPNFVETEAQFLQQKASMVQVADIKAFEGFVVSVPNTIDISQYSTVVIWCESFSEFITAATYQ
jgi:hypothetical protein